MDQSIKYLLPDIATTAYVIVEAPNTFPIPAGEDLTVKGVGDENMRETFESIFT